MIAATVPILADASPLFLAHFRILPAGPHTDGLAAATHRGGRIFS